MAERRFIAPNTRESFEDYLAKAGRVAVFVDAANVIYTSRRLNWNIDYKRLYRYFATSSSLVSANYYVAIFDEDKSRRKFLEMLSRKGFAVSSKPIKHIQTGTGVVHKGNCDVELTMDMVLMCDEFDTAILMSGDSDFAPIIKYLHKKGKMAVVISTRGHIGRELIDVADRWQSLDGFRQDWQYLKNQETPP